MSFDRIPDELKQYIQFACHREKRPFDPRSGKMASVTDPQTWCSFDEAVAAVSAGKYPGIGFVLTERDPYCVVDLDDPHGRNPDGTFKFESPDEIAKRHSLIIDTFDSYTELSPSGRGVHIWIKAKTTNGTQRDGVEVYSSKRFMTLTGNVVRDLPIVERQELAHKLWEEMSRSGGAVATATDAPETLSDEQVIEKAKSAVNGELFEKLYGGDWSGYPSQSEADFSLIDVIAHWTQNRAQIARIFRSSGLGRRKKAQRDDYVFGMIEKALVPLDRHYGVELSAEFRDRVNRETAALKNEAGSLQPTPTILPVVDARTLLATPAPPRVWHVPGMIPGRNVTNLGGDGGTGKTLLALQLALATTTATTWLGMNVRQGCCVFFTAEDERDEIHRRLETIATAEGVSRDSIVGLDIVPLAGMDALLAAPAARAAMMVATDLYRALETHIAATRPALVVLDTRADVFGGEENQRSQVRQFVSLLRKLALNYDATIVLLSHPSLTGINSDTGTSGSTAWNNSVRSHLYFKRAKGPDADPDLRILTTMKANYGRTGGEVFVRWEDGRFVFVTDRDVSPQGKIEAEQEVEKDFLKKLANFTAQGRTVSDRKSSLDYAPKKFAAEADGNRMTKRGYEAAMERLFATGRIRVGKSDGPPSKQKDIIKAVEGFHPPYEPPANLFQPPCDPPC